MFMFPWSHDLYLHEQEGSVSIIRFSPDGDYLAVCSGGGNVGLWELNLHDQGISKVICNFYGMFYFMVCVQRLHVCSLLKEGVVRDLVWDGKTSRVFLGDDQGRVAITYLPKVCQNINSCLERYSTVTVCIQSSFL